ncbi:hypothetical protein J0X19_22595 [Hymenobacter sp. BT186]|uniref:Uncharacterized protein n=1 Tax=Hymenobacter telluris TaxID=2816474 RepID=A0A939F0Z9_9BACT|nr:hypothetical protein [Hymenobacter telluris]MBO0360767.1 hypothetical protein [Hymenobacter telluris]MBW3376795.1 hypothetical protein [Hymenobacter norwichensis]
MESTSTPFTTSVLTTGVERNVGFNTIDGHFVSCEEGEDALRSGRAVLVGGLLVGLFAI